MNAVEFIRIEQLLNTLNTNNKCKLGKIINTLNIYDSYLYGVKLSTSSKEEFIKTWKQYNDSVDYCDNAVKKIMNTKKVRQWCSDNKDWCSGYSMGEDVVVSINIDINGTRWTRLVSVADRRAQYSGSAKKYNGLIAYGHKELNITFGKRSVYKETVKSKNNN